MRFSSSRPKKNVGVVLAVGDEADVRVSGARAADGASARDVSVMRPGPSRRGRASRPGDVLLQRHVEEVDVAAVAPERLLDLARARVGRRALHRPGLQVELLRAPDAVEDHAQVPVVHRVAEEEEVALGHPLEEREGDLGADVAVPTR